jgi:hypothetical protein
MCIRIIQRNRTNRMCVCVTERGGGGSEGGGEKENAEYTIKLEPRKVDATVPI